MARKPTVVVVDDEPRILRFVRAELEADNYRVLTAKDGESGLALLERERPDLVVLDLILPGIDGFEVLRRIRATSMVPVIVLTAKGNDTYKIRGLDLGADDYMTKPFNPEELAARIRAVLRRSHSLARVESVQVLDYGDVRIDFGQRRVVVSGREVQLSPTEWQLLFQLAANAGRVILHEDLLSMTWGAEYRNDLQYLRVWISRLRRKLGDDPAAPRIIRTAAGIGYMLNPPRQ